MELRACRARALVCAGWLLALVAAPGMARGQTPPGALPLVTYGTDAGLGQWPVQAIAQDSQGLLWIGTDSGVYVYDGRRFRPRELPPGLSGQSILGLSAGRDGVMWCITAAGSLRWAEGRWQQLPPQWSTTSRGSLSIEASGRAWMALPQGLFWESAPGRFEPVPGWPGGEAYSLLSEPSGEVYVAAPGAIYHRSAQGEWSTWSSVAGLPREHYRLVWDDNGRLWLYGTRRLWVLSSPGELQERTEELGPRWLLVALRDRHGTLWLGTSRGLVVLGSEDRLHTLPSPPGGIIRSLFEDQEGSLWVGMHGLHRAAGRGLWRAYTEHEGLPSARVWALQRDGSGQLWAATPKGLARATREGWQAELAVPAIPLYALLPAPDGALWLGGEAEALLRYEPRTGRLQRIPIPDATSNRAVVKLLRDPAQQLWVLTTAGSVFKGSLTADTPRLERVELPEAQLGRVNLDLFLDSRGRLWLPSTRGLIVLEQGRARLLSQAEGLRPWGGGFLAERRGGELCVTYLGGGGLSCFRYEGGALQGLVHIDESSGLSSNNYFTVGEDASGRLWVGSGRGVDVLEGQGRGVRVLESFSATDGLPGDDCNARAFLAEPNGDVWVGTNAGLARFLGSRYRGPPAPPEVVLTAVRVGDELLAPGASPPRLPHWQGSLEVSFAAVSFLYQLRLERQVRLLGLDDTWRRQDDGRVNYAALAPGRYELQARARHPHGGWGPVASQAFIISPAWWQTWWFHLGWTVSLGGLLVLSVQVRQRALHRRNAELSRLVELRTQEVREAQARLVQLEKATVEQQMAGGFAHEMRNALTGAKLLLARIYGAAPAGGSRSLAAESLEQLAALYQWARELLPTSERRGLSSRFKQLNAAHEQIHLVLGEVDAALSRALSITRLIMEYAGLSNQRPGTELVALGPLVSSILREAGSPLEVSGIAVEVSLPRDCAVPGLEAHFYSILKNLLMNAQDALMAKEGPGPRELRVSAAPRTGGGWVIEVADTGVGIPPESLEKIFAPFFSTKPGKGTGLGLGTVQKLVSLYGGTLTVESRLGEGSRFILTLPALPPEQER